MDGFLQGLLGGIVPAALMVIVYLVSISGRLARIETNIDWLKKVIEKCPLHSKDRST